MRKLNRFLTAGLIAFGLPSVAVAGSITEDSLVTPPATVNLNLNSAAFAYYGDTSITPLIDLVADANPTTDSGNLGNFTAFDVTGGSAGASIETLPLVSYTGGAGGSNPSNEPGTGVFDFVQNGSVTDGFSITSTLFAPTETFNFYIQNYDTTSDITVSLNDGATTPFTLTNKVLFNAFGNADGTGQGNTAAVLALSVTGSVGDVLTFSDLSNVTGVSDTDYADTALTAVTIDAIPEPGTCAMFGLGALSLLWRLRRKSGLDA